MITLAEINEKLDLISAQTDAIAAAEGSPRVAEYADLLASLYANRQMAIIDAMEAGVVPSFIAMVTGVGATQV